MISSVKASTDDDDYKKEKPRSRNVEGSVQTLADHSPAEVHAVVKEEQQEQELQLEAGSGSEQREVLVPYSEHKRDSSPDSQSRSSTGVALGGADGRAAGILKLLFDGLIDDEQYLALQLLEKGYIPHSPDAHMSSVPRSTGLTYRDFVQPDKLLVPVGARPSSKGTTHPRGSPRSKNTMHSLPRAKPTYNIYPNKIQVLEKILDRVYAQKSTVSTQCD